MSLCQVGAPLAKAATTKWEKITADSQLLLEWPRLAEMDLKYLAFGSYQLKQARHYIVEHLRQHNGAMCLEVSRHPEHRRVILVRGIQSRHKNDQEYPVWLRWNPTDDDPDRQPTPSKLVKLFRGLKLEVRQLEVSFVY